MKYLNKSFSSRASTKDYRDNYDRTFGKKNEEPAEPTPVNQDTKKEDETKEP